MSGSGHVVFATRRYHPENIKQANRKVKCLKGDVFTLTFSFAIHSGFIAFNTQGISKYQQKSKEIKANANSNVQCEWGLKLVTHDKY